MTEPFEFKLDYGKLKKRLEKASLGVKQQSKAALLFTAEEARNETIRTIQTGGRTGKVYKRGGVTHKASAPGEPPKSDRGHLVRSFFLKVREISVSVVNNVGYSKVLDEGNKSGTLKARPFKEKIRAKFQAKLLERLRHIIAKETKK